MIFDCRIIDADNCPDQIRESGNEPWNFLGEVRTNRFDLDAICGGCNYRDKNLFSMPTGPIAYEPVQIVALRGYLFITDDMIEVVVYWGRCDKCRNVYWARSGPPFRRARAFVTAQG